LELLDGQPITPRPKTPAPKQKKGTPFTGCTLAELAKAKNLPIEHLRALGWRDVAYGRITAVAIPWPGGTHYRVNLDQKPKYVWNKGEKVSILGIERLEEIRRGGWVLFVEGDTDYAAGSAMGLPVVALPGASTWNDEWAFQFQGCHIYAFQEPGKGGETFVKSLGESFWQVRIIEPPDGIKDLCDLHDQAGAGAHELFEELKAEARPWRDINPKPKTPRSETPEEPEVENVPDIDNKNKPLIYRRDL
jgi:hypothetical protein